MEIVAENAVGIMLCCCMMAVRSSLCNSSPAVWTAAGVLGIMDVGSLKYL